MPTNRLFNTCSPVFAVLLCGTTLTAQAGPYTGQKNNACPKGWEDTTKPIPVITDPVTTWADQSDANAGLAHIANRARVETIDKLPVTAQDRAADALTIASECLVYRNFEVDTADYVPPTVADADTSLGWLPAAIY